MKITVTEDMRACLLRIHDAYGVIGDSERPMSDYAQAWTDIREAQEKLARLVAEAVERAEERGPKGGTCCSCGYDGEGERPCRVRADRIHCDHWWDGKGGSDA